MTTRKQKQRKLVKAGFQHAKGWIRSEDMDEFSKMEDRAKEGVEKALKGDE